MKTQIDIKCNCGVTLQVDRTNEIPEKVVSMGCNWCPECMKDDDYYEEWYIYPKNVPLINKGNNI